MQAPSLNWLSSHIFRPSGSNINVLLVPYGPATMGQIPAQILQDVLLSISLNWRNATRNKKNISLHHLNLLAAHAELVFAGLWNWRTQIGPMQLRQGLFCQIGFLFCFLTFATIESPWNLKALPMHANFAVLHAGGNAQCHVLVIPDPIWRYFFHGSPQAIISCSCSPTDHTSTQTRTL